MAYILNGVNLTQYGIYAGKAPNSNVALQGAWDMPKRTGDTYHNWLDENGIEPYLSADEIVFDGRDIIFYGYVFATSKNDALDQCHEFYNALDTNSNASLPFVTDWATYNVRVLNAIPVGYVNHGVCSVQITFREPAVSVPALPTLPEPVEAVNTLDGISFDYLGITKTNTDGSFDMASMKQNEYTGGIGVTKRNQRDFSMSFYIEQPSYASFNTVVNRLYAIFAKAGARTLILDDGSYREVFVKDGFTVNTLIISSNMVQSVLTVNFTEIRDLYNWDILTDENSNILTDASGRPLIEVLKEFR